ncbi:SH3 domain-containing protein [Candidatus Hepatincolaceae symbiont of Richtersius coronifer]
MNMLNIILSIFLAIVILGSAYLIKLDASKKGSVSYPFFLSTRDDVTNIRSGPSLDYPIVHIYKKKGMPLKILDKNKDWYYSEDFIGNEGWVYKNLLSSRKTAVITAKSSTIYKTASSFSKALLILERNNIINIISCKPTGVFCKVNFQSSILELEITGWISTSDMWGNTLIE